MAKRKPRSPFCVDNDNNKYVELKAIMHPMVAMCDGLPLTTFGRERTIYLALADAIAWCEKEKRYHDHGRYETMLVVLRRFEAQSVEPPAPSGSASRAVG